MSVGRAILDIDPSWGIRGGSAIAKLRPENFLPWPRSTRGFRWRLRHNDQWLSDSLELHSPISFDIVEPSDSMTIEAYVVEPDGTFTFLARGRVQVLQNREQILDLAIRNSDARNAHARSFNGSWRCGRTSPIVAMS